MAKDELTKENFKKIFNDNFEMTNYVIQVAQDQIAGGNEELNVTDLLKEIRKNPPQFVESEEKLDESD